jgi:hypothetical protein
MGLPRDASKEQIESRYVVLVRQSKANSKRMLAQQDGDREKEWDIQHAQFHRINEAYKQLMGYPAVKPNRIMFRELSWREKIGYIRDYYLLHILGGLMILGLAGYIVFDQATKEERPPGYGNPDIIVSIMGEFGKVETEKLRESLYAQFPQWVNIRIKSMYARKEARDEYDIAMQQKQFLVTAFETPSDVYLMDETQFSRYVNMELFKELDGKAALSNKLRNKAVIRQVEGSKDKTAHTYGFHVTDSPLLQGIGLAGDVIAGIRMDGLHPAQAELLLDRLLEADQPDTK